MNFHFAYITAEFTNKLLLDSIKSRLVVPHLASAFSVGGSIIIIGLSRVVSRPAKVLKD